MSKPWGTGLHDVMEIVDDGNSGIGEEKENGRPHQDLVSSGEMSARTDKICRKISF